MIIEEFKLRPWQEEAVRYYDEMFYKNNDDAHNMKHVNEVLSNMLHIIVRHDYVGINYNIVFMCAVCHDLFTGTNRKIHHILAANYVIEKSDIFLNRFNKDEINTIANAVLEHRASGLMETSNFYSRLLKTADKGVPDLNKTLKRTIEFNLNKGFSVEQQLDNVLSHIDEKFYRDGYLYKDRYYYNTYELEIKQLWDDIDKMKENNNLLNIIIQYNV